MWGEFAKSILRSLTDLPRRKRRAALAAVDLLLLSLLVWVLTAWRYGELQPFEAWQQVVLTFVGPVLTVVTFLLLRVYHMVARYIGPGGALRLSGFVVLSTLAWSALLLFAGQLGVPRSVIFLYAILGSAVAVAVRLLAASMLRTVGIHLERTSKLKRAMPVLIYGTGELAVQLSRALKLSKTRALAGYIDDSFAMIGRRIYGAKIYRPDRIPMLVQEFGVEEIILAVEKQTLAERQALLRQLEDYRIRVRIVPDLEDIAIGRVQLKDLRGVEGRDLLGREEVQPDPMLLGAAINGKSILVTGAGGSIGSQLARQIAELEPKRLVLLDHSEGALYEIDKQLRDAALLRERLPPLQLVTVLGSVLDSALVAETLANNRIETVFHAAAFKHVPLVESHPLPGVVNNTLGTELLARAAIQANVERFVLVSTDKAVRPTSVMGASKRFAELVLQGLAKQSKRTIFSSVRFGNVLDSSGSVIRRFREQINNGGPVTVTDPEVVRYFMSLEEASNLVIQAAGLATGGEVFVLDMGDPVKIDDIARSMIRLMGLDLRTPDNPEGDIEIHYTGLRPGEKLIEELLIAGHNASGTLHPRIKKSHEPSLEPAQLLRELELLKAAVRLRDRNLIISSLSRTIDGYTPDISQIETKVEGARVIH